MSTARVVLVEDHTMVRDLLGEAIGSLPGVALVASVGTVAEGLAACLAPKPELANANPWNPEVTPEAAAECAEHAWSL